MIKINKEDVVLNLIKQGCEEGGCVIEEKVFKMAQILNINSENYEKIKTRLLETGKINKDGENIFLL